MPFTVIVPAPEVESSGLATALASLRVASHVQAGLIEHLGYCAEPPSVRKDRVGNVMFEIHGKGKKGEMFLSTVIASNEKRAAWLARIVDGCKAADAKPVAVSASAPVVAAPVVADDSAPPAAPEPPADSQKLVMTPTVKKPTK